MHMKRYTCIKKTLILYGYIFSVTIIYFHCILSSKHIKHIQNIKRCLKLHYSRYTVAFRINKETQMSN